AAELLDLDLGVERAVRRSTAAARRAALAHVVDDHRAHHAAHVFEEMAAVLRLELAALGEAQERFMHERARLERPAPAAAHARSRERAQLRVRGLEHRRQRAVLAPTSEA